MKIQIHQNVSNILDENRVIIHSFSNEQYVIYPDSDKLLRNKLTGLVSDAFVCVGSNDSVDNYEEVDR